MLHNKKVSNIKFIQLKTILKVEDNDRESIKQRLRIKERTR